MATRILIVDDEPDLLTSLARSLRAAGYEVETARDGESALTAASARPALILCDVMMPGLNGFQTCRKLKEAEATRAIPVLLMSAKVDPADAFWAEDVGAEALLRKPLDTRELTARVAEVIASREEAAP